MSLKKRLDGLLFPHHLFAFRVHRDHTFEVGEKKYKLKKTGMETLELLEKLFYLKNQSRPKWPVLARSVASQIIELNRSTVLIHVISTSAIPELQAMAIWLRGRMAGHIGTKVIASLKDSANVQVRKEVARALRRMSDWGTLDWISQYEEDPKIRNLAKPIPAPSLSSKLARFKENVAATAPSQNQQQQELVVNVPTPVEKSFPGKSLEVIAAILRRIRWFVSEQKPNQ